jgi:hypothetical protein
MPRLNSIDVQGHCKFPGIGNVISKIEKGVQENGKAMEICDPPKVLTAKRVGHAINFENIPCSGCRFHGHNLG